MTNRYKIANRSELAREWKFQGAN